MLGGLVLAVLLTARCASYARVAQQVRQDTLRLHVLARSDSPADQLLKLRVRDAVLAEADSLFRHCTGKEQARALAGQSLPRLRRAAQQALAQWGEPMPVEVYLTRMEFSAADYSSFGLPPGEYDALRVELGGGRGHNWFCVLYPGLCLPAAEEDEPAAYPEPEEQELVTGSYQIRFAAVEWWQTLCAFFGW